MTRHRHHAISTIVDGMLITPARRRAACRPHSHATGLILTGSISAVRLGYCKADDTSAGKILSERSQGVSERSGRRCAVVYNPIKVS